MGANWQRQPVMAPSVLAGINSRFAMGVYTSGLKPVVAPFSGSAIFLSPYPRGDRRLLTDKGQFKLEPSPALVIAVRPIPHRMSGTLGIAFENDRELVFAGLGLAQIFATVMRLGDFTQLLPATVLRPNAFGQHDGLARQFVGAENVDVPLRDQDAGGVLEDLGQHDDRLAVGPQLQDPGIPHAVLGPPLQYGAIRSCPGTASRRETSRLSAA